MVWPLGLSDPVKCPTKEASPKVKKEKASLMEARCLTVQSYRIAKWPKRSCSHSIAEEPSPKKETSPRAKKEKAALVEAPCLSVQQWLQGIVCLSRCGYMVSKPYLVCKGAIKEAKGSKRGAMSHWLAKW